METIANNETDTITVVPGKLYVFSCNEVSGAETLTLSRTLNSTDETIQAFTASAAGIEVRAPTNTLKVSVSNGGAASWNYELVPAI